jgi:ribonuclease-3
MVRAIRKLYNFYLHPERAFVRSIYNISGIIPSNPTLFKLAFQHSSAVNGNGNTTLESNERLEYLGDAILGAIISDYLFQKYPTRNEGWLTDMRSKIVNRQSLNELGIRMGLDRLILYDPKNNHLNNSMVGNTLEAFIGAVHMDGGYEHTRRFVLRRIVNVHIDLNELEQTNHNFKSQLMEYAQKHKIEPVAYELLDEATENDHKVFKVAVKVGEEVVGTGIARKKKTAEQRASEEALIKLNVIEN